MKMRREGGKGMGGIEFFPSEEKFAFQKKLIFLLIKRISGRKFREARKR